MTDDPVTDTLLVLAAIAVVVTVIAAWRHW
jgi:hypothetical protein